MLRPGLKASVSDMEPCLPAGSKLPRFALDRTFVDSYAARPSPLGFNGLGELVFLRTYSRIKPDGTKERWHETVERVVNGTYNMHKEWVEQQQLEWKVGKAQQSAQEMYDRMWSLKFTPPGRGLWAMGSPITEKKGLYAALQNCAFVSTKDIGTNNDVHQFKPYTPVHEELARNCSPFSTPFVFLMDQSMLGVGVGFDTRGAGTFVIPGCADAPPHKVAIDDSREGWVDATRMLVESYAHGLPPVEFDYSRIRKKGVPLKNFGGVSSGPGPLIELHEYLRMVFSASVGNAVTSRLIVDVMNLIGKCVVSGNLRRTAEIAFGDPDDDEYVNLKNYERNPERAAYGWTSNNTVFAHTGMDYTEIAERTRTNGEPGYAWLDNMKQYARMRCDPGEHDMRVEGGNPCVTGDTIVMTSDGPTRVDQLISTPCRVVVDGAEYNCPNGFFPTGTKPVYALTLDNGSTINVTADHKILTAPDATRKVQGQTVWKEAKSIQVGEPVVLSDLFSVDGWSGTGGTFEEGWLLGIFMGDGYYYQRDQTCKVEFWGEHRHHFLALALQRLQTLGTPDRHDKTRKGYHVPSRNMCGVGSRKLAAAARENGINVDDYKKITDPSIMLQRSSDFQRGFIMGMFDTDGSVQGTSSINGMSVRLSTTRMQHAKLVHQMLLHFGVNSKIYMNRQPEGRVTSLPNGKGGYSDYTCKAGHELIISRDNIRVFAEKIGFENPKKKAILEPAVRPQTGINFRPDAFVSKLSSFEYVDILPVYDCNVDDVHCFSGNGIVVHNCLEQPLEPFEMCTLCESYPARHKSKEDFLRTLKFAYLYAKTVTLGKTHWPQTNRVLLRNRRIGASMAGIAQFIAKHGLETFREWCADGYATLQYYDRVYSEWLAIPRSIKRTSVKPGGSVPLLAGATPGMHYPTSRFYLRRVRLDKNSELIAPLRDAGYHVEPCVMSPETTAIVSFPIDSGTGVRAATEVSMWEQLSLAAFMQREWADNQVSCTVSFHQETEGHQIAHALDYFQYQLKGVSFLPHFTGEYAQLPYETITAEQFVQESAKLRPADFSALYTGGGARDAKPELFCDGDKCIAK